MTLTPALFLDRDGVINIDTGYVHQAADCEFVEGIFDLVKRANSLGYKVIVVTNQAGIARGYYTEAQFLDFSAWMKSEFNRNEAHIDEIYFCPHHPVHGLGQYHIECDCRKPAPGMFLKAQAAFNIDMQASVMVGDNISDLEAAIAANVGNLNLFISNSIDRAITDIEQTQTKLLQINAVTSLSEVKLS
ncbi:MAG: D-glycero-beta-D-manno-heptose 1,7-bisphosphate 7-phosphatase [Methylotenera sp.]|uniref:D-glycero-beta-D-manno-heptose 1,7-bisphosphate 7-phosphatase n=1 Tax=Methylotenera sp. TaxID=2051956 RepID=UPI0024875758|nr:D-glycero-beta-D-manno-heptose 1,7-bisphosphate 7-phosphatase [Methylotenera sp.]MDI1310105.1 D-glycero-beta-D-manno-heptose 1,7-bisphosphate 7-phosphatase [Methylotenera sp.]